jgi:hypothetical protein
VLIVVLIVALVAVVSAPMFLGSARRARTGEGTASLAAVHHEEFRCKTDTGAYLAVAAGSIGNAPDAEAPGLALDFTANMYFGAACFSVVVDDTYGFVAVCDGGADGNSAPRGGEVAGVRIEMRGSTRQTRISYDGGSSWGPWE